MRLGAVFPQVEIESDPGAIRAWAEAVEELGFDHVLVYDHVTGVDPEHHPGWAAAARAAGSVAARPYDVRDSFHEVMVLLGFLAACCDLELVSGVLVLPQRQAALAAKQAAQVDILSEGRLRLGVGIGWNDVESRSMGRDFSRRAQRLEEQIELLRRYWTEKTVVFEGDHEWARGVGIAPAPVQRPIPIWIGAGRHLAALRRAGRLGDGWLPVAVEPEQAHAQLGTVREAASAAGRDPDKLGLQARIEQAGDGDEERLLRTAEGWAGLGATHLALNTMRCELSGADAHLRALARARDALTPVVARAEADSMATESQRRDDR